MIKFQEFDIRKWVQEAETADKKEFRAAIHTILSAIASDNNLRANMVLKGGILLAIRYLSHRYTKDIDFSSAKNLVDINPEKVVEALNLNLAMMAEALDYDLDCKVQTCEVRPVNVENPTFPSIKMKIGYAYKGTKKHKRLMSNQCPTIISIDYNLNEPIPNIDSLKLETGDELLVYSLTDLIAEKYRSLLQQVDRNRNRRQDVFDLCHVVGLFNNMDPMEKRKILESLMEKSKSRDIIPTVTSIDLPEVRERAEAEYHTLTDEVDGVLPDFDESFDTVIKFYKSLPWT